MHPNSPFDISVVLIAHHESLLVHRTLKSVYAAVERAQQQELRCEILVVLDRGDDATRDAVARFPGNFHQVIEVNVGDPALAREAGRKAATGKYIALIDGDDLFGTGWLGQAFRYAECCLTKKLVLHAEHQQVFEAENLLVKYRSSTAPGFEPQQLVATNFWTCILFFNRAIFSQSPFTYISRDQRNPHNRGYGFEDWHWITEQLGNGAELHVVPGTCNFVRRKHSVHRSLLKLDLSNLALLPPTALLDPVRISQSERSSATRSSQSGPSKGPSRETRPGRLERMLNKLSRFFQKGYPKAQKALVKVKREARRLLGKRFAPTTNQLLSGEPALVQVVREVHDIEPKVFPIPELISQPLDLTTSAAWLTAKYRQLCMGLEQRPTHVILVPWLKRGGSDLETINYVEALCQASPDNYPIVVATLDSDSPWANRLCPHVPFIKFGEIFREVDLVEQKRMLGTFLVQLQAPIIHNMNSELGFMLFRDQGTALRNRSKLYASVFCEDITPAGRVVGYAFNEIADCFDHLSGIFADNERILNRLHDLFGFPEDKLHVHYQPMAEQAPLCYLEKPMLHVLWAGRMDQQKRPDLLYQIVQRLANEPFHFSIYGGNVLSSGMPALDWSRFSNASFYGPYDGFENLPLSQHDVLLHTAQWEGLPNVLLEAMVRELPVVASDVGGVAELVQNGRTGIAVSPFDDVEGYCQALRSLHADRTKLRQFATQGRDLVLDRHSWESFHQTLAQVPEYYRPVEASPAISSATPPQPKLVAA